MAAFRMKTSGMWKGTNRFIGNPRSHVDLGNKLLESSCLLSFPVDKTQEVIRSFGHRYRTIVPDRDYYNNTVIPIQPNHPDEVYCFTDGSRTEEGTGFGFAIRGHELSIDGSKPLCKYATVFQAETAAISEALGWLIRENTTARSVTIFSDSQAAVRALAGHHMNSRLTLECSRLLNKLSEANRVTLQWIPGHKGHTGNETADALARSASAMVFCGPAPSLPLSLTTVRREVRDGVARKHIANWTRRTNCRQSKEFCKAPSGKMAAELLGMNRSNLRDILQIMTGHGNLAKHRHTCGKVNSPQCTCGMAEETAAHFLGECPRYGLDRLSILGNTIIPREQLPSIPIRSILTFTRSTGRLNRFGEGP